MVVILLKRDNPRYNFELAAKCGDSMRELVVDVCRCHNLRLKVTRFATAVQELGRHGPIRPIETRGISTSTCTDAGLQTDFRAHAPLHPDEHMMRTGCAPEAGIARILVDVAEDTIGKVTASKEQTPNLSLGELQILFDRLKSVVEIAYPEFNGLPSYDPVRMELDSRVILDGKSELQDEISETQAVLWLGSRMFSADNVGQQTVGSSFGCNEKTKLTIKLSTLKAGPPVRESRIDEESHKSLMQHYYKRQKELDSLREAEKDDPTGDSYLSSEWANPKQLKNSVVNDNRAIRFTF